LQRAGGRRLVVVEDLVVGGGGDQYAIFVQERGGLDFGVGELEAVGDQLVEFIGGVDLHRAEGVPPPSRAQDVCAAGRERESRVKVVRWLAVALAELGARLGVLEYQPVVGVWAVRECCAAVGQPPERDRVLVRVRVVEAAIDLAGESLGAADDALVCLAV
jgi:hypothetical protein